MRAYDSLRTSGPAAFAPGARPWGAHLGRVSVGAEPDAVESPLSVARQERFRALWGLGHDDEAAVAEVTDRAPVAEARDRAMRCAIQLRVAMLAASLSAEATAQATEAPKLAWSCQ